MQHFIVSLLHHISLEHKLRYIQVSLEHVEPINRFDCRLLLYHDPISLLCKAPVRVHLAELTNLRNGNTKCRVANEK